MAAFCAPQADRARELRLPVTSRKGSHARECDSHPTVEGVCGSQSSNGPKLLMHTSTDCEVIDIIIGTVEEIAVRGRSARQSQDGVGLSVRCRKDRWGAFLAAAFAGAREKGGRCYIVGAVVVMAAEKRKDGRCAVVLSRAEKNRCLFLVEWWSERRRLLAQSCRLSRRVTHSCIGAVGDRSRQCKDGRLSLHRWAASDRCWS